MWLCGTLDVKFGLDRGWESGAEAKAGLGAPWLPLSLSLHRLGEIGEEFVGQLLGRPVDQALPELRQFAADLRLDIVAQQGAAVLFGQPHRGAALGETGDPALAFARDPVAIRRV